MTRQVTFVFVFLSAVMFVVYLSSSQRVSEAQVCADDLPRCGYGLGECSNYGFFSLPAVDIHKAGDWYVSAGHEHDKCGEESCLPFFHELRCACGQPYGERICTAREKGQY